MRERFQEEEIPIQDVKNSYITITKNDNLF